MHGHGDATDSAGEETLAEAFWSVAHELRRAARETLGQWDVAPAQMRALGTLLRHGELRLSELSEHLHIAPRSTTEVVDALEAKGLVARRPDPVDRRATLVGATPEGERVGAAVRAARGARSEQLFDRLTATDRADLARILRRMRG